MSRQRISGHSVVADLVRETDWSSTPLGAIESWSETLCCSVNLILNSPVPMQMFWGTELTAIYNDALLPYLAGKHPSCLGKPAREIWEESWEAVSQLIDAVLERGESCSYQDTPISTLIDGQLEKGYWTFSYSPIYGPDGTIQGLLNITQSTTQSVLAQQSLRASEKRFRLLVDKASVGIALGAVTGELTYLNPSLLNLLGYSTEEVAACKVRWDMLTPPEFADLDAVAIHQLQTLGVAEPYEKAYYTKSGECVPLLLGAAVIPADAEYGLESNIAVFITDLSKQKTVEQALLRSEKLAAVGKLASSISHEINNPLAAITNLLYLARRDAAMSDATKGLLEAADRELSRVSQISSHSLRFYRQSTMATRVQPDVLIDEMLHLYTVRLETTGVEVRREFAPDLWLTCYEGNFRQVMNNLIGNAADAMSAIGGCLTLRARYAVQSSSGEAGILFTVADNGEGMSPEVQRQIFDAFYTTKGTQGTGLGLWITYRIAQMHSGYVKVRSSTKAPHRGTVVELWLPVNLSVKARELWDGESNLAF
jgi:PAS domain S-box-containing protein